jgi:hypothetical protein
MGRNFICRIKMGKEQPTRQRNTGVTISPSGSIGTSLPRHGRGASAALSLITSRCVLCGAKIAPVTVLVSG